MLKWMGWGKRKLEHVLERRCVKTVNDSQNNHPFCAQVQRAIFAFLFA